MRHTLAFAYILLMGASGSVHSAHAAQRYMSSQSIKEPSASLMNSGANHSLLPRGSSSPIPKQISDHQAASRKATEGSASEQPPSKRRKTGSQPAQKDPDYKAKTKSRAEHRAASRNAWRRKMARMTDEEREEFQARKRQYSQELRDRAKAEKEEAAGAQAKRPAAHQNKPDGPSSSRRPSKQRQQRKDWTSSSWDDSSSDGSSSDDSSARPDRSPAHRVVRQRARKVLSGKSDSSSEEGRASTANRSDGPSRSPSVLVNNVLPVPPDELR